MALEGNLELLKLPEVLQMISQQQKTGILTVQGPQDYVAVYFLQGKVVAADSLGQTAEEGLAQTLVSEGLLGSAEVSRAVAEHGSAGGRLIDLLVMRGYLRRDVLLQALRTQILRLLQQPLHWQQGEFKFYAADEVSYEEGIVPIPVEELLFQGAPPRPRPAPAPAAPVPAPIPAPVPGPAAAAPRPVPVTAPAAAPVAEAGRPPLRVVRPEGAPARAADELEATSGGRIRKMAVAPAAVEETPRPLLMKVLPALLALLLVAVLVLAPGAIVLPFPWQDAEREALAREQRASLYMKIDRAAKTFFLLEGRFPERLSQLQEAGFLSALDLRDPQGRDLQYQKTEESYTLQPMENGKPVEGTEMTEAITGNFLLDPEFLATPAESSAVPLVLLD